MKITITLESHQLTCVDVIQALKHSRLNADDHSPFQSGETGVLRDDNCNTIGRWLTEEPDPELGCGSCPDCGPSWDTY